MNETTDSIDVLHVDPDEQISDLVATYLERADDRLEVHTETDPTAALERLEPVDCVVSDYEMPHLNGLEFLEAVRDRAPDLPFVLFTGRGSEEIASEAISAGVTDYLQKGTATEQYELLANKVVNAVEQYHSAAAAERTQRRLSELADNSEDVLWIYDADWSDVQFVNSAYEDVYGRSIEDALADPRDFLEAVHPEDRETVRSAMQDLTEGTPREMEYRVNEADDYQRWVWVKASPVYEDGEVVRIAGFSRDVTARKRRKQEFELRSRAMDEAPMGITITDPDKTGTAMVYANEGFRRLTGFSADELEGSVCEVLAGERTDPDAIDALHSAVEEGEAETQELRHYRADGSEFWNELSVAPVTDEDDVVTNYVAFHQNVTDRKRREKHIEVLNRVLRHNLRNDMNTVYGFAEMIAQGLPEDHEHREYAEAIKECSSSLMDLSETAGQLETTLRETESPYEQPVAATVEGAVDRIGDCYPDASIEIEGSLDAELSIPATVEEAVVELLDNAIRHSGEPTATVEVSRCSDRHVTISVLDEGPGIPEQERQVLKTGRETQLEHGSGLGLWLVYWVATGSGGSVRVPEVDDGARVDLVLPTSEST